MADAQSSDSETSQAQQRLREASDHVRDLKANFNGSITQSASWQSARSELDNARRKLAQAYTAGNVALQNSNRSFRSPRTSYRYFR